MSTRIFVIRPKELPDALPPGDAKSRREVLTDIVAERGASWGQLELGVKDLDRALRAIDVAIEGDGFLPVLAFAQSPAELLDEDEDETGAVGYLDPMQVADLVEALRGLSASERALLEENPDRLIPEVLHLVERAAVEARRQGAGLAFLHDFE